MGAFENQYLQTVVAVMLAAGFIWVLIPRPNVFSSESGQAIYRIVEAAWFAGFIVIAGIAMYQDPKSALYLLGFPLLMAGCVIGFKAVYNFVGILLVGSLGFLFYETPVIALMILAFVSALIGLALQRNRVSYPCLGLFAACAIHTLVVYPSENFTTWLFIALAVSATYQLGYKNRNIIKEAAN